MKLDISKLHIDVLVSSFINGLRDQMAYHLYIYKTTIDKLRMPWVVWASMGNPFEYEKVEYNLSKDARRYETRNINFSAIKRVHTSLSLLQPLQNQVYSQILKLSNYLFINV